MPCSWESKLAPTQPQWVRLLPALLHRAVLLGKEVVSKATKQSSILCRPARQEVDVVRCPSCESESVTWDPNGAECYSCGWKGSGYDLWDDGMDDDD